MQNAFAIGRVGLALSLALSSSLPVWAQTAAKKTEKAPAAKAASPQATAKDQGKPLEEGENPDLIGKRNINKHQINFYGLEKEVAVGRQFAQEVDQSAKLVEDPIVVE
ncbi:MAG: hypothetical protein HOP19_17115, partial [Acidobacteria bacterium]|nr:hypothetical protein [Acidobacteriota bacterium]